MSIRKRWLGSLLPVLVALGILSIAWLWLGVYTRHSAKVNVPRLAGLTLEEAQGRLVGTDLQLAVVDSVFDDAAPKGTVTDQDPKAGMDVKPGRTIYVVMNARQPKMIDMPALVDLSKRQALSVLEIIGLKVGELQYRADPCVDCVVAQLYRGEPIAPDARIRRGESISLVLGSGTNGAPVPVPDVLGMSLEEAKAVLNLAGLNLGLVVEVQGCVGNTPCDTALASVYRQVPASTGGVIGAGAPVDLWLTLEEDDDTMNTP